jgi:hypothetical protein
VERDATDKARKLHSANFGFDRTAQKTNWRLRVLVTSFAKSVELR